MSGVDQILMAHKNALLPDQGAVSRKLSEEKNKSKQDDSENKPSLRDLKLGGKLSQDNINSNLKILKSLAKDKQGSSSKFSNRMSNTPATQPSKELLKTAWTSMTSLVAIPIALVWINIHALMQKAMPFFFCKLGDEWIPYAKSLEKNESYKQSRAMLRIIEPMALYLLNATVFFVILVFLVVVAIIGLFLTDKIYFLREFSGALFDLF